MKTLTHTVPFAALLALLLAAPAVAGPGEQGSGSAPGRVATEFYLFTGSPDPSSEGSSGVLLAPGTVIPVDAAVSDAAKLDASLAESRDVISLAEKLGTTLRLADIRPQYKAQEELALDRVVELPPVTPGSTVRPRVTLLGESAELATYRVTFRDGSETLSETTVGVPPGRRSIVGGLDGEEAPYVFLMIRPLGPDTETGFDEDLTPPRALSSPAPQYPEAAREEKVEGVVIVQVVIEKDGTVSQTRVLKGLHPELDRASREAISTWTFEPARLDGEPVSVFYNMTIRYRLDEEKDE